MRDNAAAAAAACIIAAADAAAASALALAPKAAQREPKPNQTLYSVRELD